MKKIILADEVGEFCTARNHPKIPELHQQISACLTRAEPITIDRTGVKILSASFIDDLVPPLILRHSRQVVDQHLHFSPPLEPVYLEQIERGVRLRRRGQIQP